MSSYVANASGGIYYAGTAATTSANIQLWPVTQVGQGAVPDEGPLEWLRRSVSEITELAAA
jgi:hypothetical protein